MRQKTPKKTIGGASTQALMKTAKIVSGELVLNDRDGVTYTAHRTPDNNLAVLAKTGYWSGVLQLDGWSDAELTYWEAELDKLTPAEEVLLLCDATSGKVVGHMSPAVAAAAEGLFGPSVVIHPFRLNNAAGKVLPALGDVYFPPPAPVRPRRTRGLSRLA